MLQCSNERSKVSKVPRYQVQVQVVARDIGRFSVKIRATPRGLSSACSPKLRDDHSNFDAGTKTVIPAPVLLIPRQNAIL
jgi:hypothetical protein